jgi:hypothetical protein
MSGRKKVWTAEQDEQLRAALTSATSVQRLAIRFQRSESSIKSHAKELGLTLPVVQRLRETIAPQRWVARKRPRTGAAT